MLPLHGLQNPFSCDSRGGAVERIGVNRAGLTLAVVLAGLHLLWGALVAIGVAQPLVDFVFRIHMMEADAVVGEFAFGPAILLLLVTAAVGYGVGAALAATWNLVGSAEAMVARRHLLPGASKPAGMS